MRTIRENAEKVLEGNMNFANDQMKVSSQGKNEKDNELFTLRSFAESEAKSNPNFFRWLFNDYSIEYNGVNMTDAQKAEYKDWLKSL